MTQPEEAGWNAGVNAVAAVAQASADALRARVVEAPTRFPFAIEALEALVEAAAALIIPPEGPEPAAVSLPRPRAPSPAAARAEGA